MVERYVSLVLKLCSLGLVVFAGSFWAGAGVDSRPKYKDEQTLVGGAIWSQTLIPIGLMISSIVGERLDIFVHGYFLFSGFLLLISTGFFLIIRECLVMTKHRRNVIENVQLDNRYVSRHLQFDRVYFSIGVLCLSAGLITFADFIVTIMG